MTEYNSNSGDSSYDMFELEYKLFIEMPPLPYDPDLPPFGEGPDPAGDREPRKPKNPSSAGAVALLETQLQ